MNAAAAEEYTASLGQIAAGTYRQVLWAQSQGVPKALGLTTEEWVDQRLGGYVRLGIAQRREVVKELTEEGLSTREQAGVLGVDQSTVARDQQVVGSDANASPEPEAPIVDGPGGVIPDANASPELPLGPRPEDGSGRLSGKRLRRYAEAFTVGACRCVTWKLRATRQLTSAPARICFRVLAANWLWFELASL